MQPIKQFVIKIPTIHDIGGFAFIDEALKLIAVVFFGIRNRKTLRLLIILVQITEVQMQLNS